MSQVIEHLRFQAITRKIGPAIVSWDAHSCDIIESIPGGKLAIIGTAATHEQALRKIEELEFRSG